MGLIELFKRALGKTFKQTWESIDWNADEEVIMEQINGLLKQGAYISEPKYDKKTMQKYNILHNDTMLSLAIKKHKFKVAELLVEKGAKNDKKPLSMKHFCLLVSQHNQYIAIEKMKKTGVVDPMVKNDEKFQEGDLEKIEHLMEVMLAHGFDVNEAVPNCTGNKEIISWTDALTHAAEAGNLRLVEFLHKKGAKINREEVLPSGCAKYKSSMGAAAASGDLETLNYLHENGGKVNPSALSVNEPPPISRAIITNNHETGDFLLEHDCDVNLANNQNGMFPLMYAAWLENEQDAIKWTDKLFKHKADATLTDKNGMDASQIAITRCNKTELAQKITIEAKKQREQRKTEAKGFSPQRQIAKGKSANDL